MQENWDDCEAVVLPSLATDGLFEVACMTCGWQSAPMPKDAAETEAWKHEQEPSPIHRGTN